MKHNLYTWNWVGGGYNQTYAENKAEALKKAKEIWSVGVVDMSTFKLVEDEKSFWKNYPLFD
jgi:hypothetical protein